jgi:hypothetical protein
MNTFLIAALVGLKLLTFDVDATPSVGSELTYQRMEASWDLSLRARGIVLFGAGDPIVLCAVDWIGIANESQDAFKEALAAAAGTTPDRVEVHTVHQHDAPICDFTSEKICIEKGIDPGPFEGSFQRQVIATLAERIAATLDQARPVTAVGFGSARVHRVASNRAVRLRDGSIGTRYSSEKRPEYQGLPRGLVDPQLSMVSFWDGDEPLAALSFYATHPQSFYRTRTANPDFPGVARMMMDLADPDVLHIHFNGAGGNVAAGKYNDGSHKMRRIMAKRLERAMRKAWRRTKRSEIVSMDWETEPMLLPADEKVAVLEDSLVTMARAPLTNSAGTLGWYRRRNEGHTINAACLAVNDIRVLFMPGELFVEYQLAAKKMRPRQHVAMAAYGDYGPFYIGTRTAYETDIYEVRSSPVTADAEAYILDKLECLLKKTDHN